jgi:Ca2+-transporting ATPase
MHSATITCRNASKPWLVSPPLRAAIVLTRRTQTFTGFVFLDLVSAIQNRGLGCALGQNRVLLATVGVSWCTQIALVYVPLLQAVFQTEALSMHDLASLLLLATLAFGAHEARRRYERNLERNGTYAAMAEEMA